MRTRVSSLVTGNIWGGLPNVFQGCVAWNRKVPCANSVDPSRRLPAIQWPDGLEKSSWKRLRVVDVGPAGGGLCGDMEATKAVPAASSRPTAIGAANGTTRPP